MIVDTLALFARPRPYYIVAEDYDRTDSAARVMHELCHALNVCGNEAYILAGHVSQHLRTPVLSTSIEQQHREAGLEPIVVYPETELGNPLAAGTVIRYCYRSSLPVDAASVTTFCAHAELAEPNDGKPLVISLPFFDRDKYQPGPKPGRKRLAYTRGYPDARLHFADLLANCETIDETHPATEEKLIALLQGAERLYCFGESALAVEAALCGCPVVYVPTPGGPPWPAAVFRNAPNCFTLDDSEAALDAVRTNLGEFGKVVAQFEAELPQQLLNFVDLTQALPVSPRRSSIHEEGPDSILARWATMRVTRPSIDARRYAKWRAGRTLQEIDGELMAERMLTKWPARPRFHLLCDVDPAELPLLADTLDALAAQLYQDWLLTIVAPVECPEGELDTQGRVRWITQPDGDARHAALSRAALEPDTDWCALVQPGVRLEPFALQMLGDYIAIRPDWHFIYTDEDLVDRSGKLSDPRFKPDLNIDLLRSIDYLGGFCPARVSTLRNAGGIGELRGAETYDIALRVLDHCGASAIGHISEILYHSPTLTRREPAVEAERQSVQTHLARLHVDAVIQDGHGYATRRVIYRHPTTPLVSIVIASRDKAEFLAPCIESLFARTRYPAFEVIILDVENTEPDARNLLDRIAANGNPQLRVLMRQGGTAIASHYNAAAELAKGDYLLFLDDDCIILQDDWLDRLMSTACRPEVGMVGPRFASPGQDKIHDTGLVLGFRGVAGTPYNNVLAADAPGYLGFKTLDQNVSAISPACMLVRASLFRTIGGFQSEHFPNEHAALDLCLRLNATKHWIVWTPYVTLARYGSGSRLAPPKDTVARGELAASIEQETDALVRRWLRQLAHDSFYNPNLSLSEAYLPDHRATVEWDINFHDRKRVIGFPLPGGSGEYRIIAPFRAISRTGLAHTSIVESDRKQMRILSLLEIARAEPDVIVVHQAVEYGQIAALESYKKYCPTIRRVTGLDDLVSLLPPKHPSYRKRAIDIRPRLRASLALCDRVIVSTEPLAELCRPLIDEVIVMPNCLEWEIWGTIDSVYAPAQRPRVGWIGAQQHYGDLEHIFDVVRELADEVDWIFMGMCPDAIRPYVKEYHSWTSGFAAYASKMSSLNLDLAIAPLDVNPFNEAKSNLRLLEYGAMRWPVVCTDIYPYQNAPVTRVPNTKHAWIDAIREKLSDRAAARREGEALRSWVESSFILENRVGDWLEAFTGR